MKEQVIQSNEEIKEYLKSFKVLNTLIDSKIKDIKRLRSLISSVKSINTGEKVKSSNTDNSVDNTVIKIVDLEKDYKNLVLLYINKRTEFDKILNQMNTKERLLIELKYINGLTWEQVAWQMNYSERVIYRLHNDVLNKLKKIKDGSKSQYKV